MNRENIKEFLTKLNQEQYQAATYNNGSTLVLAAAGSGKTSTLISRIAYLVGLQNVMPQNILAVTFTNKAAKEMSSRLFKMGLDTNQLWMGTFHSICNKILRYHAKEAGLNKNFYIMDQQEQLSFLKRALRSNGYDPKSINVNDLQDKINNYKEAGWRSNQLRVGSQERKFYEFYEEACLRDNCVDFAELLLGCYELFEKNPLIEEHYAEKFIHILVDEFQDTNELQYKWLKKLGFKHGNVFAVGDDDQCLVENTLINTPYGKIKIQDLNIGDEIFSKVNDKNVIKEISKIFQHTYKGKVVKFILDNNIELESTLEHVWFSNSEKSNNIYNIELTLCHELKDNITIHQLKINTDSDNIIRMTSDKYEDLLNYAEAYENNMKKENDNIIFIQNANIGNELMNHVYAKDIKEGMFFIDENNDKRYIKKIEIIEKETKIYDLNIEGTHNYIANGIVTHNSIYGFRGANPKNLELFKTDFKAQLIKIEKNYRSDAYILEAANAVIKNNQDRQGKNLVPTKKAENKLNLYSALSDDQEAMFISNEIKNYRRSNIHYKNMAILYRTNGQSRALEKALNAQGVPYIVYGGFRFFDRQEVKHAMAYLRLANNPNDNMAFLRVANIPARAIGETALKKLDVIATEKKSSLYQAAQQLNDKERKKYQPFLDIIDILQDYCKGKKIADMTRIVIQHSGLEDMYQKEEKDGEERLDNLYELISAAEVFQQENKQSDINEFLAFSTLDSDMNNKKKEENVDAVKLMTVHASKGLEFDVVFISGLEESLFPHANSLGDKSAIEEERRLMYVALTRAKKHLYLSYSEERFLHGQRVRLIKSRFLKEIPNQNIAIV